MQMQISPKVAHHLPTIHPRRNHVSLGPHRLRIHVPHLGPHRRRIQDQPANPELELEVDYDHLRLVVQAIFHHYFLELDACNINSMMKMNRGFYFYFTQN